MRKKILIGISIILLLFVILFGRVLLKALTLSPVLFNVLFNKQIQLKKTESQSINILLLGIGGGTHEGPDLSDTIIFASLNPEKNKVSLVSIPRDFWVPDLSGKINTAYAIGKSKRSDGGLVFAKAAVSKIVGQPISYGLVINFDGFVKAVDLVGGLDIKIERSFDDYRYPIEGKEQDICGKNPEDVDSLIATQSAYDVFPCRFEHVHFDQGLEHMDGKRSLIFVRSRYAQGTEGTDFARSQRQQKAVKAFKDRVFSLQTVLNPVKISDLYTVLSSSIDTDIKQDEFDDFIKLAQKMRQATIRSAVLDTGDEEKNKPGLLINPPVSDFNGVWVLIPRRGNGNFSEIQQYVHCVLTQDVCLISSSQKTVHN